MDDGSNDREIGSDGGEEPEGTQTHIVQDQLATSFGDISDYPDGSIIRITYNNFLTYDNAVMYPGPRLNVIVGANGTGKSTVICGICLALGGSPKILGRSERLGDYIKHGADEGTVKLLIRDSHGNKEVMVRLKKPNIANYFINEKSASQAAVKSLVAAYHIQIDNPCTFLAQDKVKSFSEQNPVQLLMNTEKAGDYDLLMKHEALLKMQKEEGDIDKMVEDTKKRIGIVEAELVNLEPRVQNFNKKQDIRTKINVFEKKMAILHYEESCNRIDVVGEEASSQKKKYEESKKETTEIEVKIEECKKRRAKCNDEINNLTVRIHNSKTAITNINDEENLSNKVMSAEQKCARTIERSEKWEASIEEKRKAFEASKKVLESTTKELEQYDAAHSNYKRESAILEKTEIEFEQKRKAVEDQLLAFEDKRRRMNQLKERQDRVQSARENLLAQLFHRARADEAWQWYKCNRQQFDHPVYVPILHMELLHNDSQLFLENMISVRDFSMFIFGSKHDENLLARQFKISSTVLEERQLDETLLNVRMPNELRRYGFTRFASELFTGPLPVRQYLAQGFRLHCVPIGNKQTEEHLQEVCDVIKQHRMQLFFTATSRVSVNVSRYSSETVVQTSAMRTNSNILAFHQPTENVEYDRLREEVEGAQRDIDIRQQRLNAEKEEIHRQRAQIKDQWQKWRSLKERLESTRSHLRLMENQLKSEEESRPDVESAKAAVNEAKKLATRTALQRAENIAQHVEKMYAGLAKCAALSIVEIRVKKQMMQMEGEVAEQRTALNSLKMAWEEADRELQRVKKEADKARNEMKQQCGISTTDTDQMNKAEVKAWEALQKVLTEFKVGDDLEAVGKELMEEKKRLEMTDGDGDIHDVEQYKKLEKEKIELNEKIANQQTAHVEWKKHMLDMVNEWKDPLVKMIEKISESFFRSFDYLGCTGEVQLDTPVDPLDISAYGISILVRFRAKDRLRRLDHQVQSGGERSVSTMLYLIALQELCPVPFRCVDEINQGMDPTNERKVFDVMVDKLSGMGNLAKSQYFLLTPKLLHGLKFSDAVTIQIVHNGPTMHDESYKWDAGQFLRIMKGRT